MQQDVDIGENKPKSYNIDELKSWLRLEQIPNFSVAKWKKAQQKYQITFPELFAHSEQSLQQMGFNSQQIKAIQQPKWQTINESLEWVQNHSNRFLLHFDDPDYPQLLKHISSAPPLLFGYGDPNHLAKNQIAIVGSRNPSPQGRENAKRFAYQLSQCGWLVTSGLALGVDGFSHKGAVSGGFSTIAVLGTAINNIYPRRHVKLADEILENDGVIISEFAPNTQGRSAYFPRRNRIISGLSLGTLIVEAAIKSGSLITAKYALEQNREVFAIPGSIHNPMSAGCHFLIQQGAKLVTNIEDINEEFQFKVFSSSQQNIEKHEKNMVQGLASDKLLDSVDFEVTPLDIVVQRSGIEVVEVMSQLLEYEMRGLVTAVPGGYIKLGEK